jgi:hypothetical protein
VLVPFSLFRHPRESSAGIHPKKAKMDARLKMSGMTAIRTTGRLKASVVTHYSSNV